MFMELYANVANMYSELDEDEEMVHPLQIGYLLVDWMDPQKSMYVPFDIKVTITYDQSLQQCAGSNSR